MFCIRRPSADFIEATKAAQRTARFTYDAVGWTREGGVPDGFAVTQWKQVIGRGEAYFELSKRALVEYRMLNLGWLQPVGCPEPIATDSLVCTLARQGGLYSLNVGRIIYVHDAPGLFMFGYGTLPEYPVRGEERFSVACAQGTKEVTFEIFSFSRPHSPLMLVAKPFLRRIQRRFCTESSAAMSRLGSA